MSSQDLRDVRPDEQVSVVFVSQVKMQDIDGVPYAVVVETMNTPFVGEHARRRAEAFMEGERERDFTEADGWWWRVSSNEAANKAYSDDMLQAMGLGADDH